MGKLARLNAGNIKYGRKKQFIVIIKRDFSYEMVEEVNGLKVNNKVENYFLFPMGRTIKFPSVFESIDEANEYLKELVNDPKIDEKGLEFVMSQDFHILEIRYSPKNKKMLGVEWAKENVLNDIPTDIKSKRSSQLI